MQKTMKCHRLATSLYCMFHIVCSQHHFIAVFDRAIIIFTN